MSNILPTTRIAWWDEETKNLWEPRIERIQKAYNAAELTTVISDMRRVFVYHVNSTSFDESYEFLRKNNLVYYPTNKSALYNGFSHRHLPTEPGKPYMLYGAAVKNDDLEAGELFSDASVGKTDHSVIGELLGYPECCVDFFNKTWGKDSIDPMYEAAIKTVNSEETDDGVVSVNCHPYCNNLLRYFGIRITPHLTCSMQCENTIKWGEEWIDIMSQVDEEAAEWAVEMLSSPLTWSCLKGVAIIDTPWFRGVTNSDNSIDKKIVKNLGWVK